MPKESLISFTSGSYAIKESQVRLFFFHLFDRTTILTNGPLRPEDHHLLKSFGVDDESLPEKKVNPQMQPLPHEVLLLDCGYFLAVALPWIRLDLQLSTGD